MTCPECGSGNIEADRAWGALEGLTACQACGLLWKDRAWFGRLASHQADPWASKRAAIEAECDRDRQRRSRIAAVPAHWWNGRVSCTAPF